MLIIEADDFFQSLLDHLLYGKEMVLESKESPGTKPSETRLSELERQQRGVALCAWASVRKCREYFKTNAEYITMFWSQYTYYKVRKVSIFIQARALTATSSLSSPHRRT